MAFYEFPILYSEFNTATPKQFAGQDWYEKNPPQQVIVKGMSIDALVAKEQAIPTLIKIDVEGAEYSVLQGMKQLMKEHSPIIVMEYLAGKGANSSYRKAIALAEADLCLVDRADEQLQLNNVACRIATVARNGDDMETLRAA